MAQVTRISVEEAATRLGVSARTVRNRLSSGELKGERISAKNGTAWAVEWQDEAPPNVAVASVSGEGAAPVTSEAIGEAVGAAVDLAFNEMVAPMVEKGEQLARDNERLAGENERLRAEIVELEDAELRAQKRGRWWRR